MAVWVRKQGRGLAVLVALAIVMAGLAVFHRGVPAAKVNLNDGGVWVTNQALRLVGHLNYPSRTLDGGVRAGSARFDLSQHANTVLLHDTGAARVQSIDNALVSLGAAAPVHEQLDVQQGGDTAAVLDAGTGKLWILDAADIGTFSPEAPPVAEELKGARLVVGSTGEVAVVLPTGAVKRVERGELKDAGAIEGIADLATAQLTSVGADVVVFDRASSTLRTTQGSSALPSAERTQVQVPGPKSDRVLVALADSYAWVPLRGGEPTTIPADAGPGTPARPALLGGCAYLAWSGTGQYVRDCPDDADDRKQVVEKIKTGTQLVFRTNRDIIVLNDVVNGTVLLVNENMKHIDNWLPIDSQLKEEEKEEDDSTKQTTEISADTRKEQQTKPVAVDDDFGARPGRNVELPVLINDSDADGDLLTASVVKQPAGATVSRVRGGQALSIAVPDDATGTYTFTYAADDGRGGSDEATVTVKVAAESTNDAPKPLRTSETAVGSRGQIAYPLLTDWIDPEGDTIFLADVTEPAGLEAKFRADGHLMIRELGTTAPGEKEVKVVVSDGTKTREGVLKVTVKATGNVPPVANNDHVTVLKDQEIVVKPLENDVDANGDDLRLAQVQPAGAGQKVVPDYAAGSFVFSSSTVGTVYLLYKVTDGPSATEGWVRIDVAEPAEAAPLAADDIAILPDGGSVMVEPLANDTDPSGGVLVLQSIDVPESARAVAAEIVDHGSLRISAPAGLTAPVTFTYAVANAHGVARGRVAVMPLPASATSEPPVAVDDKALVRQGDIVTVPVLANDSSPSGQRLTLDEKVTIIGDAAAGDAFASRDSVRLRANKPGTIRLSYTARDEAGNFDSAQVVVSVTALDAPNQPPQPRPLVGRVLAGGTVTIQVPTDGADPDGDSVTVTGLASAPGKGTALVNAQGIEYSAPAGAAGTDTFSYEVADRFGVKSTAAVRVGIAPAATTNQSPVAVPDDVSTRPGRTVNVNAVANDSDPDGDPLALVAGSVKPVDGQTTVEATEVGTQIEVTTPGQASTQRYYYDVTDNRGGTGRGVVTVKATPDAPLRAPVARDDHVALADITGRTAEVDVLANDYDPDGAIKDLTVVAEGGATVNGQKITVSVTDQRQVILYTVTDVDGMTGRAAIVVPPADAMPPHLNPDKGQPTVKAGQLLTIPLDEYVIVRSGHRPLLTFATKVKAGPGADQTPLIKDDRTLQFQADPDFVGLSSITFEVTDGANADDPNGLTAVLTLPITVESSGLHQPVFRPSDVTVAAGEPAKTADLKQMVTDEDPGDLDKMRFTLGRVSAGFQVSVNGSTLSVSAPPDASPGTSGTAEVTVTDSSTDPVTGTVALKVTASTRPLINVTPATINDARAGQPSTIDLAQYLTNPFAAEGKPVELVGTPRVSVGQGTATASGLRVTVTPGADFNGQLVVTYTAKDATGDPNRNVNGTIKATVRARPDAPTGVVAETHVSRTATVSWTAGANNGAPIQKFTVRWSGGSRDCGAATNCTITGLTNNVTYAFTVTATNVVGESDPSGASNQVRPDVKPNPPGTPVGTFGDRQIALSWAAAATEGSPVTRYTVEISPAPPGGSTQRDVTGTSLTWSGLSNGVSYAFRVQAHSSADEPSDWSGSSVPVVPAGPPKAPTAPRVAKDAVSPLPPSATVSWGAPDANGDANLTYEMRRSGGSVLYTGTATSRSVTLDVATDNQTFEVRAKNKAGWGPWSPASNAVRGWKTPGAVTNLTATAVGQDNTVDIKFGAAAGNGALPNEITYYWKVGGTTQSIPVGGGRVRHAAFVDGQNVSVAVYAVARVNGESAQGTATSATVSAYGPPVAPTPSCSGYYRQVNCRWSGGDGNGRSTTFRAEGDWSGSNLGASGGPVGIAADFGQSRRIRMVATQNTGSGTRSAVSGYAAASAWAAPGESYFAASSPPYPIAVGLDLRRWRPNSSVRCYIAGSGGFGNWSYTARVDGSGNFRSGSVGIQSNVAVDSTWRDNCKQA